MAVEVRLVLIKRYTVNDGGTLPKGKSGDGIVYGVGVKVDLT